ncbi:MAG: hypothetical protein R3C97_04275 [Geminicoccaceae bacterium]
MRGLQSLRQCLPHRGLHHHGTLTTGSDPRTGEPINNEYGNWTTHPNNPMRQAAE